MKGEYHAWLAAKGYAANTINGRMSELNRIETEYGPVADTVRRGRYQDLLDLLTYSTEDARQGRPNPTRFAIAGDLRTNIAAYRASLRLYKRFLDAIAARKPERSP